jgi:hypothetical protein
MLEAEEFRIATCGQVRRIAVWSAAMTPIRSIHTISNTGEWLAVRHAGHHAGSSLAVFDGVKLLVSAALVVESARRHRAGHLSPPLKD